MKRRRFNWVLSDVIRQAMRIWLEWSARVRGQRFYCRSLGGESEYNLTINCDLTVSCACQDYDGSGHLGDLNKNSFPEVFFGPVAQRFREDLAKGKLPIKTCARCCDLVRVPKAQSRAVTGLPGVAASVTKPGEATSSPSALSDAERAVDQQIFAGPKPRLPHRGMLLENTVRCNIDCLGCDRQSAARIRTTQQMDMEKLGRMADLVHSLGLKNLFYLNLGEPFLSPNIGPELSLLRQKNPECFVQISTNGIVLNTDVKREAALNASHICFSIAGVNEPMLKKYERLGNFQKAYDNLKALVAYRNARGLTAPVLEWKYLLFNWNDHPQAIAQAIEMANAAGVDIISFWPTHNPFYGFSFRYALGRLNHVGVKSWKGRELDLRPAAKQGIQPACLRTGGSSTGETADTPAAR